MARLKKRILVVDDEPAIRSVLEFILKRAGHRVTQANNGREAWEYAEDAAFDLVVTDCLMPEMNGPELCERLRSSVAHRETPIIVVTAKSLEMELPQLRLKLGLMSIFTKPFSPQAIACTAHGYLRGQPSHSTEDDSKTVGKSTTQTAVM